MEGNENVEQLKIEQYQLRCMQQAQPMNLLKIRLCSMGSLSYHHTRYHHMPEIQKQALQQELPLQPSTYIEQSHKLGKIQLMVYFWLQVYTSKHA